jgi:HAD superfamily hydrolase (TIGR01509 family)
VVLRALVFDFDGLIADTEWPEYRAVAEQFERHGLDFPPEDWVHVIGSSWDVDWLGDLERRLGRPVDRDAVQAARRARSRTLRAELAVLPGVEALLEAAQEAGLGLAVASSSPRSWVQPHLEALGLAEWFTVVCTRDDVARTKPAPDLFLAACAGLGVAPPEAIALEDSAHGANAARAAGLRCVVVPNRLTVLSDLSHADLLVTSMAEVELVGLRQLLAELASEGAASPDATAPPVPGPDGTIAP